MTPRRTVIGLALQGGGSHGAYAWGALDALLEDGRFDIAAISGTSGGAINGAVLAAGLPDGIDAARTGMTKLWRRVIDRGAFSPIGPSPVDRMFGNGDLGFSPGWHFMDAMTRLLSPGQIASWFNPLDLDPLRDLLEETVDLGGLRRDTAPRLFVNATNVQRGTQRLFDNDDLTIDGLMASAAIPFLFKPARVDGERYWDGGFLANPDLTPLVERSTVTDIVVIQVTPFASATKPKTATEIFDRMTEIAFGGALRRDLAAIAQRSVLAARLGIASGPERPIRLHLISSEAAMAPFTTSSKLNTDGAFIERLFQLGYDAAQDWLATSGALVGQRDTLDTATL